MNVEIRAIKQIRTAKYNPRRISDQQLASLKASIERFGFVDPVIVNDRTGTLVGGHQRIKAAKDLGLKDVPVVSVNLDEGEEKALNVALNKISGEWDLELLRGVLDDVVAEGLDLSLTGFTEEEWSAMSGTPAGTAGLTDPDEVPELPEQAETITQPGDLWLLGDHRLLCGDSTKAEDVARVMDGKVADLLLSDPPYCSGGFQEAGKKSGSIGTRGKQKIANDTLSTRGYMSLMKCAIGHFGGGVSYVFTDWRMWINLFDVMESSGFGVRQMIVWDKGTPGMGVGWRSQHELIMAGMRVSQPFDPKKAQGNVINCKRTGNPNHPTEKPVELLATILNVTDMAESVYDPFLGSGTTLIAAEQLGRKCYGLEISPQYCDVIVRRWEQFTGRKATRGE